MQLRPQYLMKAVSQCLSHVVAPAIDKSNGVAQEQVAIAIGLLEFMAAREPMQFDFDCSDLAGLIDLLDQLTALGSGDETAQAAIDNASAVLDRARAGPADMAVAARELRERIRVATDALHAQGGAVRTGLQKAILGQAKQALAVERAWLAPLGFERGAQPLPPLEDLLRKAR